MEEKIEVLDDRGRFTGRVEPRSVVHSPLALWHAIVHIFVVSEREGEVYLDFQQRGLKDETWPGRLDALAGGHVSASPKSQAGEELVSGHLRRAAVREMAEEVGVVVEVADLIYIGRRAAVGFYELGEGKLKYEREIFYVYFIPLDLDLCEYTCHPQEVNGVARLKARELITLLLGEGEKIAAEMVDQEHATPFRREVNVASFVPPHLFYFPRVGQNALRYFEGRPMLPLDWTIED